MVKHDSFPIRETHFDAVKYRYLPSFAVTGLTHICMCVSF
jgi:hypothetical protein